MDMLDCGLQTYFEASKEMGGDQSVFQRSSNLLLLQDQKLLPDQMQRHLPDSEPSVKAGALVFLPELRTKIRELLVKKPELLY